MKARMRGVASTGSGQNDGGTAGAGPLWVLYWRLAQAPAGVVGHHHPSLPVGAVHEQHRSAPAQRFDYVRPGWTLAHGSANL